MQQLDLQSLHQWFKDYARSFYAMDTDIQKHVLLKETHTFKVVEHSRQLSKVLGLSEPDQNLAEAIALFHDVGRFKQYAQYRTFVDHQSVDHARLGLEVIADLPQLAGFTAEERDYFTFAIANHNTMMLPKRISERQRLFATIIRDTDKLDIYRVLSEYLAPPSNEGYSPIFIEDLMAGRQSSYLEMKTPDDRKLMRLSWIYDISYPWTLRKIMEQGYIEQIIGHLPGTPEIQEVVSRLRKYAAQKIGAEDGIIANNMGK